MSTRVKALARFYRLPIIAIAAAACSEPRAGDRAEDAAVVRRDSAGVTIVENHSSAWEAGTGWSIEPEPRVAWDGAEHAFERLVGVVVRGDGGIVTLDAGSGRLEHRRRDGSVAWSVGGRGEGPGEFRRPASLTSLVADTVMVWDAGVGEMIVFDPTGSEVERARPPRPGREPLQTPIPLEGRARFIVPARSGVGDRPLDEAGRFRFPAPLLGWAPASGALDTLATIRSNEVMAMDLRGHTMVGPPPFPAATLVGVSHERIVVADAEALAVRQSPIGSGETDPRMWLQFELLEPTGRLATIVRAPLSGLEVTPAHRDTYVQYLAEAARTPQEEQMIPALASTLIFPDRHPAYHALLVDATDHIWLRVGLDFSPMKSSPIWHVFSPDGRNLGNVTLPERFTPHVIDGEEITGVWHDALDVESVRTYTLRR